MITFRILSGLLLALCLLITPVSAQNTNFGLTPNSTATQSLSVTNTTSSITLATTIGATVVVYNTGTKTAYLVVGPTATTTGFPIPTGVIITFNFPPGSVISAITGGSDTTTLVFGKGLGATAIATLAGAASGGGGAVTVANGADVALGSTTDAVAATPTSGTAATTISLLKALTNAMVAATPAGANIIGKVGIDQTTPGTTNGTAIVGVNAATALAGAGAVGTGSLRVAVGQDTTTVAGSAPGTAGSASANVVTVQGVASMTPIQITQNATPTIANGNGAVIAPSTEALAALTPIVSAALESNHVIKAGAGNFYAGYVTTGATGGWLLLANSTTAPTAGGAAIAPIACVVAPANASTSIGNLIPIRASTGITLVFSTSGCLTNTASATAYFSGMAD